MKTRKEERKVMQSRQNESFPPENLAQFLSFSHPFAPLHKQTSPFKGAPITQTSNPSKLFSMTTARY
jgi:hypothetical protein